MNNGENKSNRELGDFQTPNLLAREIIGALGRVGDKWARVLEPTCGQGHFIEEILKSDSPPKEILGVEIQEHYCRQASEITSTSSTHVKVLSGDIFNISLNNDICWEINGPLLVIGNPPWVTNSEIGSLNGKNLPKKNNFKGFRGIDAITGKANFDIAEYIWIKLLNDLSEEKATIALLCKNSVARNVLQYCRKEGIKISKPEMRLINAKKWFGAATDACLFSVELGISDINYNALVYPDLASKKPMKEIGFVEANFVSDVNLYKKVSFAEGKSCIEWRQGVKHDAAQVMELAWSDGVWKNKLGESVDIEDSYVYPLIKGSDVNSYAPGFISRAVVIPQTETGQNTDSLQWSAPRLWNYLAKRREYFDSRKSSIYRGKPPFSIFGIGAYSFAEFKVIVSGLYKEPRFIAVGCQQSKPILCDDTCYLLPCSSALQASTMAALLNHPITLSFIKSISFFDSKRPITKTILSRINIENIASFISVSDILSEVSENLKDLGEDRIDSAPTDNMFDLLCIKKHSHQSELFNSSVYS